MTHSILSIKNLSKSFGSINVLNNINLEIAERDFLVLVGPSGCGKSTLLNCIAGLEQTDTGNILINNKDATGLESKDRDIAMVFQSYVLYPTMSVAKNISFGMKVRGDRREDIDSKLQEVSKLLKVDTLLDRKPAHLSGGQRQRVAIGRALVRNPTLFLFDEPLSNLDAKLRVEMRSEIKKLHSRTNTTIVYVTHDQIEALSLATKVAVLNSGDLVQIDSPQEIFDNPANCFVAKFIGSPSMNMISGVLKVDSNSVTFIPDHANEGFIFNVDHYKFKEKPINNKRVILGIRPEYISGAASDAANAQYSNQYSLPITLIEPNGYDQYVTLLFCNIEIIGRFCSDDELEIGKSITTHFNLSKISLFCSESEERI